VFEVQIRWYQKRFNALKRLDLINVYNLDLIETCYLSLLRSYSTIPEISRKIGISESAIKKDYKRLGIKKIRCRQSSSNGCCAPGYQSKRFKLLWRIMKKIEYKIGDKFHNFTILGRAPRDLATGKRMVHVECDCGYICEKSLNQIMVKNRVSCVSCVKRNPNAKNKPIYPITKPKYGKLSVIGQKKGVQLEPNINLRCECGNVVWKSLHSLKHKNVTTCGDCNDGNKEPWENRSRNETLGEVKQPNTEANNMRVEKVC